MWHPTPACLATPCWGGVSSLFKECELPVLLLMLQLGSCLNFAVVLERLFTIICSLVNDCGSAGDWLTTVSWMHSFTPDRTEPHNLFLLFPSASSRIHPPHLNTQCTHRPAGSHKSHSPGPGPGLGPAKLHTFPAMMAGGRQHRATNSHQDGGWGWVIVGCCFMVTVCTRAVTR